MHQLERRAAYEVLRACAVLRSSCAGRRGSMSRLSKLLHSYKTLVWFGSKTLNTRSNPINTWKSLKSWYHLLPPKRNTKVWSVIGEIEERMRMGEDK